MVFYVGIRFNDVVGKDRIVVYYKEYFGNLFFSFLFSIGNVFG